MKTKILLSLLLAITLNVKSQTIQQYPNGFSKANAPEWIKNYNKNKGDLIPEKEISIPNVSSNSSLHSIVIENIIGNTIYDLQTNGSISNWLCVNDDGTLSTAWTFSPDSIQSYPNRGSGYNYWDGINWYYPAGPTVREESFRTGFTNIVVTPTTELLIAHNNVGISDSIRIIVTKRNGKGSGAWTSTFPWGNTFDKWPKAANADNNVYVIFLGKTEFGACNLHEYGPIYFSRSFDGGNTWSPKSRISLIDTTFYLGFNSDTYSIDAKDSIVTIGFGSTLTDVGILKSTDYGSTWTKTIIQQHPIPFGNNVCLTDTNQDGIIDTLFTNGGDIKVLIDNNGMVHTWFSALRYYCNIVCDALAWSDGLEYWNETMSTNSYVEIAATQDFNGNGIIDIPVDTFTNCANRTQRGDYFGGLTIMPSAGIDATGRIYLTYSAINESADTLHYHQLHRHVYMMTLEPPYNPANWTYPYDIIPSSSMGGNGEEEEGVYACIGRNVDSTFAYVLYQRDNAPGHNLSANGTCENLLNSRSDMVLAKVEVSTVNISTANQNDLFVSQNYPNPAHGITNISIGLNTNSDLIFEVYDLISNKIYSEKRKNISAGNHIISLNSLNFSPGIYSYSVICGVNRVTRLMIVQ